MYTHVCLQDIGTGDDKLADGTNTLAGVVVFLNMLVKLLLVLEKMYIILNIYRYIRIIIQEFFSFN